MGEDGTRDRSLRTRRGRRALSHHSDLCTNAKGTRKFYRLDVGYVQKQLVEM